MANLEPLVDPFLFEGAVVIQETHRPDVSFYLQTYRAGHGEPPQIGDEMVLTHRRPSLHSYDARGIESVIGGMIMLNGVYDAVDVRHHQITIKDGSAANKHVMLEWWNVKVVRTGNIDCSDTASRIELVSGVNSKTELPMVGPYL